MPNQSSERLNRNRNEIMRRWETRAKTEVLAAQQQTSLALQDHLPIYLTRLVDALSTTIDRTKIRATFDRQESLRIGKKHGHERAKSHNYTMDQLIYEYHILRQVIFEVLEEDAPLSAIEREIIMGSIEQAVNDAATEFSDTARDIQHGVTATLAHDLRNPLTTAKTSAQLILRRPDDVKQIVQAATRINNSINRLESMIHDLLDASRIRAGETLYLEFEECDLDLLTRQVAEEFNYNFDDRFKVVSPGPILGFWSKDSLKRVIENLASNAVKHGTPKAPVIITLQEAGPTVTLSVHNEGRTITPEERPSLFQRFRRIQAETGTRGWGLGLTVVKGITEAHHGKVSIESEEGKGTRFSIELPRDCRQNKR